MDPYDTYEYAGLTIQLHYDDRIFNPRSDFDHAGKLLSFTHEFDGDEYLSVDEDLQITCPQCHGSGEREGRYRLERLKGYGWTTIGCGSLEAMKGELERLELSGNTYVTGILNLEIAPCHVCEREGTVKTTIAEYLREWANADVVIPLRYSDYGSDSDLYECEDDANAAIYCTADTVQKEWEGDRDKARKYLEGEVSEVSAWLKGDVYGFIIKDANGDDLPMPFAMDDSCWGFIGPDKYVREDAERMAASIADAIAREAKEAAAMAARGIETVAA